MEIGVSRMRRDFSDLQKIEQFFQTFSPFKFLDPNRLVNISSGVSAVSGDGVNCDEAETVGLLLQKDWDEKRYGQVTLHKSGKIRTMTDIIKSRCSTKSKPNIDPHTLFNRLVLVGERTETVRGCFGYELTPYPMSLFKDGLIRKPVKPDLLRNVVRDLTSEALPQALQYVVDGGYILPKVRWTAQSNTDDILRLYVSFLKKVGENVHVVFDGYESGPTVKDSERLRRDGNVAAAAPTRLLDENTQAIGPQEPFLANLQNKVSLIRLVSKSLEAAGFWVHQAESDADTLIAYWAIKLAQDTGAPVGVLAEDTDILVLLLHHRQPGMPDIYFVSHSKRGKGGISVGSSASASALCNLESGRCYVICCRLCIHSAAVTAHRLFSAWAKGQF